ncbi:hypothetical protein B0A51_18853 [Rachicladosporium sp. CCFEE 5018]|nr:hypothetical protein B0A51_18853 [Rachicladosporium sp. CCFEE 5018]
MQSITRATRQIRPAFLRRPFSSIPSCQTSWTPSPSPPKLDKEEQARFEKLQEQSTGAFSTPRATAQDTPPDAEASAAATNASSTSTADMLEQLRERARVAAQGDGEELHPNIRRGAKPEFEGEVNPKTGEVGGPKNEPLRWGSTDRSGDWSYNGRVTDF